MLSLNRINTDQEYAKKAGFKQGRTFDQEEVSRKVSLELIEEKIEREQRRLKRKDLWEQVFLELETGNGI